MIRTEHVSYVQLIRLKHLVENGLEYAQAFVWYDVAILSLY